MFASGSKNIAAQLAPTKHVNNTLDQDCLAFDAQLEGIGNVNSSFVPQHIISEKTRLQQSLADVTIKVTFQQIYPKTNLDAIKLDPGPSLCSSTQSNEPTQVHTFCEYHPGHSNMQAQNVFDQLFCRIKIMPIMREVR